MGVYEIADAGLGVIPVEWMALHQMGIRFSVDWRSGWLLSSVDFICSFLTTL